MGKNGITLLLVDIVVNPANRKNNSNYFYIVTNIRVSIKFKMFTLQKPRERSRGETLHADHHSVSRQQGAGER